MASCDAPSRGSTTAASRCLPLPADAFARPLERYGPTRGYWAFCCRNAIESGSARAE